MLYHLGGVIEFFAGLCFAIALIPFVYATGIDRLTRFAKLVFWLACATVVSLYAYGLIKTGPDLIDTAKAAHVTVAETRHTMGELAKAAGMWQQASAQSEAVSKQALQVLKNSATATDNLAKAATSLNTLIANTDQSVNKDLVPKLGALVTDNNARLGQLVDSTTKSVDSMGAVAAQGTVAMTSATDVFKKAADLLGDPANKQTIEQLPIWMHHQNEIAANLEAASLDIRIKIHQMTRPASFAKRVLEGTLAIATPIISIFK